MPIDMNWTPPPARGLTPGIHLLEVRECKLQNSKKDGTPMLKVSFEAVSGSCRGETMDQYFMLDGKALGLTQKRLIALGFEKGSKFDAQDLVGRRVYAAISHKENTYKGETQMQAQINGAAKDSMAGLWPDNDPPAGVSVEAPEDDEGPF